MYEMETALEYVNRTPLYIADSQFPVQAARFLINQQKYLEHLEAGRSTEALVTLRQQIAPMDIEPSRLHHLSRQVKSTSHVNCLTPSSLMMSSSPEELHRRAIWDGARGNSRHKLLNQLQRQ